MSFFSNGGQIFISNFRSCESTEFIYCMIELSHEIAQAHQTRIFTCLYRRQLCVCFQFKSFDWILKAGGVELKLCSNIDRNDRKVIDNSTTHFSISRVSSTKGFLQSKISWENYSDWIELHSTCRRWISENYF